MAMKILFDAINPKHCRIAAAVYQTLKDEYEIFVTTRDYAENKQILNANAIPYFTLGGYYTTIWSKFLGRVDRCNWLTRHVQDNGIDVIISFASIEAISIGIGVGIPTIVLTDTPQRQFLNSQIIPPANIHIAERLTENLWQFHPREYRRFMDNVVENFYVVKPQYPKPEAIFFREAEYYASYMNADYLTEKMKREVQDFCAEAGLEFIEIPRYSEHPYFPLRVIGKKAAVIVTGGSTMATEGALMGVPSLSFYPKSIPKIEYLSKFGYPIIQHWYVKSLHGVLEEMLLLRPATHKFSEKPIETLKTVLNKINGGK